MIGKDKVKNIIEKAIIILETKGDTIMKIIIERKIVLKNVRKISIKCNNPL